MPSLPGSVAPSWNFGAAGAGAVGCSFEFGFFGFGTMAWGGGCSVMLFMYLNNFNFILIKLNKYICDTWVVTGMVVASSGKRCLRSTLHLPSKLPSYNLGMGFLWVPCPRTFQIVVLSAASILSYQYRVLALRTTRWKPNFVCLHINWLMSDWFSFHLFSTLLAFVLSLSRFGDHQETLLGFLTAWGSVFGGTENVCG